MTIGGKMKVLKLIKKIIIGILAVIFFGFAIGMTVLLLNVNRYGVSEFGDTSLVIIKERISSENFKKGDLVLVEKQHISTISVGDEIFAYQVDPRGNVRIDLGIVGQVHSEEDAIVYENGATYSMEFVIGKSAKVYEKIGTYLAIILSRWGFLFMILVPSFLIFIYQIYALIVEIKYGEDEVTE